MKRQSSRQRWKQNARHFGINLEIGVVILFTTTVLLFLPQLYYHYVWSLGGSIFGIFCYKLIKEGGCTFGSQGFPCPP